MRIVGLTGGIATGKSAVTAQLGSAGLPVVDFDIIAREVCKKGRWGYKRILRAFGHDILGSEGDIDRDKLGRLIFADKAARSKLNRATHPVIFLEAIRQLLYLWLTCQWVVVVDMPLLIEVGAHHFLRPCVVVTCSHETESKRVQLLLGHLATDPKVMSGQLKTSPAVLIASPGRLAAAGCLGVSLPPVSYEQEVKRLMKRDGIDAARATEKVAAQMPLRKKQQLADVVIDNSGSPEETKQQVDRLIARLRQGASLWGIIFSPILLAAALGLFAARIWS